MVNEQLEFDFYSRNYDPLELIAETDVKYNLSKSKKERDGDRKVIEIPKEILDLINPGRLIPGPRPFNPNRWECLFDNRYGTRVA